MNQISISLIIPVYNEEDNIENCIQSILAQSRPSDEVIFVDNGSTDKSLEIICDYVPNIPNKVKVSHESNRGIPFVRNRGVSDSEGEVIAFLDGDCIAPRNYLELLQQGFLEFGVNAVTGKYCLSGDNQELAVFRERAWAEHFGWAKGKRVLEKMEDQDGTLVSGCSAFMKDTLEMLGLYDTRFRYMDDVALSERFYRSGFRSLMDPTIEVAHNIDTSERTIFRKDMRYGSDHARINRFIRYVRFKAYPEHYKQIFHSLLVCLATGDRYSFYKARTLFYHKLGLFREGLKLGAIYL